MRQKYEELFNKFHSLVDSRFKEFLYVFIRQYQNNPTRRKAAHLIMNLPVGFFINDNDIKKLFKNNRAPSHNDLIAWLSDRINLVNMIKGD